MDCEGCEGGAVGNKDEAEPSLDVPLIPKGGLEAACGAKTVDGCVAGGVGAVLSTGLGGTEKTEGVVGITEGVPGSWVCVGTAGVLACCCCSVPAVAVKLSRGLGLGAVGANVNPEGVCCVVSEDLAGAVLVFWFERDANGLAGALPELKTEVAGAGEFDVIGFEVSAAGAVGTEELRDGFAA